jgi:hypothetical protein
MLVFATAYYVYCHHSHDPGHRRRGSKKSQTQTSRRRRRRNVRSFVRSFAHAGHGRRARPHFFCLFPSGGRSPDLVGCCIDCLVCRLSLSCQRTNALRSSRERRTSSTSSSSCRFSTVAPLDAHARPTGAREGEKRRDDRSAPTAAATATAAAAASVLARPSGKALRARAPGHRDAESDREQRKLGHAGPWKPVQGGWRLSSLLRTNSLYSRRFYASSFLLCWSASQCRRRRRRRRRRRQSRFIHPTFSFRVFP